MYTPYTSLSLHMHIYFYTGTTSWLHHNLSDVTQSHIYNPFSPITQSHQGVPLNPAPSGIINLPSIPLNNGAKSAWLQQFESQLSDSSGAVLLRRLQALPGSSAYEIEYSKMLRKSWQ